MRSIFSPKPLFFAFLLSLFLIACSYYLEYVRLLAPCLLCYFQRWMLVLIACFLFLAYLFSRQKWLCLWLLSLTLLWVLLGLYFAGRQIWLQHQPAPEIYSCLPSAKILLETLPVASVLQLAYSGTNDCGIIHMRYLGLSLAEWSLVGFILLGGLMLWSILQRSRKTRDAS